MKKTKLFKSLLVAAGLLMGASAWADGNKRIIDAVDYSTISATDWSAPGNGTATLKTSTAAGTPSAYSQCYHSGTGARGTYKNVNLSYTLGTGYSSADLATNGYNIEFDFNFTSGKTSGSGNHQGQFIVSTGSPLPNNYISDDGTCLFSLSYPSTASGSTPENLFINDLANSTGTSVAYSTAGGKWLHLKLVVTATTINYTLTNYSNGSTLASGEKTISSLPVVNRFYALLGRGGGTINFTNYEVYDYTADLTVSAPTFTFDKVDGTNRVYTITNTEGSGTLYYTTAPANDAPALGDVAYTSTSELTKEVSYSESGKYYAYVLHTNGTTASAVTEQTVTAGALTLAEPVFTVTDMVQAADGYYYPVVTFSSNNSSLEGEPTATFDQTAPYSFTGVGSITVTASADGYTSSSATFKVNHKYSLSKAIDFGALTATDFDATVWETATGAPRDYWTTRAAAIPADATYYKFVNESVTPNDETDLAHKSAIEGVTLTNCYQRTANVYIGYGLLTPYDVPKVNEAAYSGSISNNLNITVNDANAMDYVVYNGWNNYGSGTFNTVQVGNGIFALYRYDTMLRTIKVYSGDYSFGIVGDLTGGWDADAVMTQSATNKNIYTLVVDKFTATANTTYQYKLRTDGQWGGYQLPASGNNDYYFENAGIYKLTFTANIKENTLTLAVEENPDYTVVGCFNNDATASFFGTTWDVNNADNLMTKNEDGTYTKTYNNVTLEDGRIYYKVVKNHSFDTNWGFGGNNADYGVNAGIYDITFTFNPTVTLSNGHNLTCDVTAIPSTVNKTISDAKYATFCSPYDLDFSGSGLTAYIAEMSDTEVSFTEVTSVPAKTGVLLKADAAGDFTINTVASSATNVDANVLVGVTAETNVAAGSFVLMNTAENGVGFYRTRKPFTVGANTAYIPADVVEGRSFIGFGDDNMTTSVNEGLSIKNEESSAVYNLSGQRVAKPAKGLYIVNGKKVVMK